MNIPQINGIEPHFIAAFLGNEAACSILDFLPDSDFVEELRNLLYIQNELFVHILEKKHYGTNNITTFIEYTQEIKDQMRRLRERDEM